MYLLFVMKIFTNKLTKISRRKQKSGKIKKERIQTFYWKV